ncbi:hypothetical protein MNBD_GAMMA04-1391 [hydrothermal vent metagenome]|uniref:Uncharacterized protein n=1 Tax=hydrothermal vent metagenome TaxID=652676 RepID=A0A3B0W230_9ZZZZ
MKVIARENHFVADVCVHLRSLVTLNNENLHKQMTKMGFSAVDFSFSDSLLGACPRTRIVTKITETL